MTHPLQSAREAVEKAKYASDHCGGGDEVDRLYQRLLDERLAYAALIEEYERVVCCEECEGTGINVFTNQVGDRGAPCPICGPAREEINRRRT